MGQAHGILNSQADIVSAQIEIFSF